MEKTKNAARPANVSGLIANQGGVKAVAEKKAQQSVSAILNGMFDTGGYRKRLQELLGDRAPQFMSAVIAVANADPALSAAVRSDPQTVVQSALKAASYDLPVDNALGYAYIVPFNNRKKTESGDWITVPEAQFILGYKGMIQLALRTGCYRNINVMDVREGELVRRDRLREDYEFDWIEDDEAREKLPVVGYVGFFRLINGAEKTLYMTRGQIDAHEKANRKGPYQSKGWRDNYDAMARKTLVRLLLGKWGVLSIDYRTATPGQIQAAEGIASGLPDDEVAVAGEADYTAVTVDPETGEILREAGPAPDPSTQG